MTSLATAWLVSDDVERPSHPVEHSLAVRAQAGDRVAQRAIYELYARRVRRFIVDMIRNHEAASDALQDTFIRVFTRIESLEDPSRFVGWMFGIARRVCLEQRRSDARRAKATEVRVEDLELTHDGPSPEMLVASAEAAVILDRALDKLGPDRRAILLMRCDHLLSYDEIATAMGFTLAKVKVEIFRARTALRAALDEEEVP